MTQLQQLQKYFSEVLGVLEILVQATVITATVTPRIIFLDEKSVRTPEGKDLLDKMIGAMKLEANEYKTLEIDLSEISANLELLESAQTTVSFSKSLTTFIENNFPRIRLESTYGPEELLKKPELKREVWESLKKIM